MSGGPRVKKVSGVNQQQQIGGEAGQPAAKTKKGGQGLPDQDRDQRADRSNHQVTAVPGTKNATQPQDPKNLPRSDVDPERFRAMAAMLHEATRNKVGGADLAVAIMTLFMSAGISMRRLEGNIEPDEARALIKQASDKLSPGDRRAFAYALKQLVDAGQVRLVSGLVQLPDGKTVKEQAREILNPFISEALATPLSDADRAVGALLAATDLVRFRLYDANRDLTVAGQGSVRVSDIDLKEADVEALRIALARAPRELADAVRTMLRASWAHYQWPPGHDKVPSLVALNRLLK